MPCDQPTRYFEVGEVRVESVEGGRAARCEELERTVERRVENFAGRAVTRRIPRESGPNAASRVEKGMVPGDDRSVFWGGSKAWCCTCLELSETHTHGLLCGRVGTISRHRDLFLRLRTESVKDGGRGAREDKVATFAPPHVC